MRCAPEHATELAHLVHEKTAGNPFFAIQFLSALAKEGLLTFDHGNARWSWNLDRIHAKGYTDNVVDLMVGKLTRLPVETQAALQQLACLGNTAEITTLSIVRGTAEEQVHSELWEAVRLELIVRLEGVYRFVHDRVQEAAYSLIPAELRAAAHLRIGRLLAAHTPPEKREEAIFEIVNQLNRGAALITARDEREQLAELNLIAGKRAKASAAYASALTYLVAGAALLEEDSWERRHELTFALGLNRAECEFLTGALAAAEERLATISRRAATLVDKAAITCLRVEVYTTLGQAVQAVEICLEYLRHLGIEWSPHPSDNEVRQACERMWQEIGGRPIEALIDLPPMTEPDWRAAMDVLAVFLSPALFTDRNLFALTLISMVNLSLEHGNCDGSCLAYAQLIMVLGPRFGDYRAGFRFGQLGFDLVERRGLVRFKARVYLVFGHHVIPWARHLRTGRALVRRAFDVAQETGDLTFAAYSATLLITNLLASGEPLGDVQQEAEHGLAFARKARFGAVVDCFLAQLRLIRALRGLVPDFGPSNDPDIRDDVGWPDQRRKEDSQLTTWWYWVRTLQRHFYAADYAAAVEVAAKVQGLSWTTSTFFEVAEYHFYGALARAASYDFAPAGERSQHLEALIAHHEALATWAENGPENFGSPAALVAAEIARIEDRELDAERLYEEAIRRAHEHGFIQNEGLANELAARFYAARGLEKIAHMYLRDARYGYLRWGAEGKVRQLDELYPHLREEVPRPGPKSTIGAPVEHLDLATVIKVSQAASGEIVFERLIDALMRTAIEHAGAQRGLLILARGAALRIQAEAKTSGDTVTVELREVGVSADELPESVLHYVMRAQQNVILDDASSQHPFSADDYIRQKHARSVLCLPLLKQGKLIAVLYLENNLAPNVFTPARIAVLKVLASEAAISLENSRLYRELQQREAKIRRLIDANIIGVVIADLEGQIIEANDAFLEIVGYSRDDLTSGQIRWKELTPAEWQTVSERAVAQIRASGTCEVFEQEYVRKDGRRVPVLVASAAFEETRTQAVSFVLNLTERKRAEEALRQAQADLAYINRVTTMGELTASLAHEIKQPIAAAITNANTCLRWLTRDQPDVEEARAAAARIVKDATRAADIISRIRLLFKKGEPQRELVDVNDLIREMIALLRNEAARYSISIGTELAEDLPEIMADRVQLQQVLMNLMLNSIDAMKDMNGAGELTIRSQQDGSGQLRISVSDTGVGLPPEQADQIFNAFFTTKAHGTGMGLPISRSIIESHGGRLWTTANVGRGATFHFTLPSEVRVRE